jgi:hypothetical protein
MAYSTTTIQISGHGSVEVIRQDEQAQAEWRKGGRMPFVADLRLFFRAPTNKVEGVWDLTFSEAESMARQLRSEIVGEASESRRENTTLENTTLVITVETEHRYFIEGDGFGGNYDIRWLLDRAEADQLASALDPDDEPAEDAPAREHIEHQRREEVDAEIRELIGGEDAAFRAGYQSAMTELDARLAEVERFLGIRRKPAPVVSIDEARRAEQLRQAQDRDAETVGLPDPDPAA